MLRRSDAAAPQRAASCSGAPFGGAPQSGSGGGVGFVIYIHVFVVLQSEGTTCAMQYSFSRSSMQWPARSGARSTSVKARSAARGEPAASQHQHHPQHTQHPSSRPLPTAHPAPALPPHMSHVHDSLPLPKLVCTHSINYHSTC